MAVSTLTSLDIIQPTGASSSSLAALTSDVEVAVGKLSVKLIPPFRTK